MRRGTLVDISRWSDCEKILRFYDIAIPDYLTEDEIAGWLSDIYHEASTERNPDVKRIE